MSTAYLNTLGIVCALGADRAAVAQALFAGDTDRLVPTPGWIPGFTPPVGRVHAELPALPATLWAHDNRCNRLLLAAAHQIEPDLQAAATHYGRLRIGVVLGTSTGGIEEATVGHAGYRQTGAWPRGYHYRDQELSDPAQCLADWLGSEGPCYVISTACTAGARALISAQRLLDAGVCDAVVCGGVDALTRLPLNGFHALGALDGEHCRPFAADRHGINLGEAAALFLMTHERGPVHLAGTGASSDAYHMSSPEPGGTGARDAMLTALARAQLGPGAIDYVNLHGTATPLNDAMEARAMAAVFPHGVPCSSTKALTGHTLAAAGALEAAFCWLALDAGRLPPHCTQGPLDASLPALDFVAPGARLKPGQPHWLMSNSFAFGGNNASLILGDTP